MYKIDLAYNSLKWYLLEIKVLEVLLWYDLMFSLLLTQTEISYSSMTHFSKGSCFVPSISNTYIKCLYSNSELSLVGILIYLANCVARLCSKGCLESVCCMWFRNHLNKQKLIFGLLNFKLSNALKVLLLGSNSNVLYLYDMLPFISCNILSL